MSLPVPADRGSAVFRPPAWPLAEMFTFSLVLAAARAAEPGLLGAEECLLALLAGILVAAWATRLPVAVGVGVVAWLFENGFVAHTAGVLQWHGATDVPVLALLLTCALGSALTGRRLRSPAAVAPTDPAPVPASEAFRG